MMQKMFKSLLKKVGLKRIERGAVSLTEEQSEILIFGMMLDCLKSFVDTMKATNDFKACCADENIFAAAYIHLLLFREERINHSPGSIRSLRALIKKGDEILKDEILAKYPSQKEMLYRHYEELSGDKVH